MTPPGESAVCMIIVSPSFWVADTQEKGNCFYGQYNLETFSVIREIFNDLNTLHVQHGGVFYFKASVTLFYSVSSCSVTLYWIQSKYYGERQYFNVCLPLLHISVQTTIISQYISILKKNSLAKKALLVLTNNAYCKSTYVRKVLTNQ